MDDVLIFEDEDEGYSAQVHHSLLETLRILWVPYKLGFANLMFGFVMTFGAMIWAFPVLTVVVHALLWLGTRDDIFRIDIFFRSLRYDAYYDVGW